MAAIVSGLALAVALVFAEVPTPSEHHVRIVTYNLHNFHSGVKEERLNRLRRVISMLDADVLGLQEVADRNALEQLLDAKEWRIAFDDESSARHNVAVAVRRPSGVPERPERQHGRVGLSSQDADGGLRRL